MALQGANLGGFAALCYDHFDYHDTLYPDVISQGKRWTDKLRKTRRIEKLLRIRWHQAKKYK
jgi:hypothetical protein